MRKPGDAMYSAMNDDLFVQTEYIFTVAVQSWNRPMDCNHPSITRKGDTKYNKIRKLERISNLASQFSIFYEPHPEAIPGDTILKRPLHF